MTIAIIRKIYHTYKQKVFQIPEKIDFLHGNSLNFANVAISFFDLE